MPPLDMMPDEDYLAGVRAKWGLDNEPSTYRANIAALVCDNQDRHFKRLTEETRAVNIGGWAENLIESFKASFRTHVLPDLCSVQPMTGPLGGVAFYRPHRSGREIHVHEIRAESRMCKSLVGDVSSDVAVDSLLTEVSREILGTLLNGVAGEDQLELAAGGQLREELEKATNTIGQQREPANRVVAGKKMLTQLGVVVPDDLGEGLHDLGNLDDKWDVYYDSLFPEGKLMTWYQGESILDTAIIYSPYTLVEITPNFVSPEDMTLRRALRTRHKITLVQPRLSALIRLAGTAY